MHGMNRGTMTFIVDPTYLVLFLPVTALLSYIPELLHFVSVRIISLIGDNHCL